jgi:hypothetical protein
MMLILIGLVSMGFGFIWMGMCPSLLPLIVASCFTGFTGPWSDLPVNDMIQQRFPIHEIPKIFRLRMAGETSMCLLFMVISPVLFRMIPVETVIVGIGITFLFLGAYIFVRLLGSEEAESSSVAF